MNEISLPVIVLIGANGGALLWLSRLLWHIDRRLVRIETKLGLKPMEDFE